MKQSMQSLCLRKCSPPGLRLPAWVILRHAFLSIHLLWRRLSMNTLAIWRRCLSLGAAALHLGATIARLGIAAPTAPSTSCVALHGPSPSIHPCGSSNPKPFVYITIHLPSQSRRTSLQHS